MGVEQQQFQRLPRSALPTLYDLTLDTDMQQLTFAGRLTVTLDVREDIDQVVMNVTNLDIEACSWKPSESGGPSGDCKFEIDTEQEKLSIKLPKRAVKSSTGLLHISYRGMINDEMKGFYRSKNPQETRHNAVTQFEATDARRAFPCWDEPDFKARFKITIIAESQLAVVSNMNQLSSTPYDKDPSKKVVVFETTPVMSTYLVAWSIGDYDTIEARDPNGVLMRVFAARGLAENARYALNVATKALPFFSDFFQIPFPLPKSDILAISEYKMGAMENWGLITYLDSRILMSESSLSSVNKQLITLIVGHELAHQWFGNLVTMQWWTDLWLNEGFAKFMEHLVTDFISPEFKIWVQFTTSALMLAMRLDCMHSSHPIQVEVNHPREVDEIFDQISYQKGASVVRMIYNAIGEAAFRKGLHSYLTHFKYGNARTADLWRHFTQASGVDISAMMDPWTKQMNYPVVSVEETMSGTTRQFKFTQRRFTLLPSEEDYTWVIPMSISVQGRADVIKFVLSKKSDVLEIKDVPEDAAVNFNEGFTGIYHTEQPERNLRLLVENVTELSVQNKMNLLFDLLQLSKAGRCRVSRVLELLTKLSLEENYAVWSAMLTCVHDVRSWSRLVDADGAIMHRFTRDLCHARFAQLGLTPRPDEDHLTAMLRGDLFRTLGLANHEPTVQTAQALFTNRQSQPIPADLRDAVYSVVAASGGSQGFQALQTVFAATSDPDEKRSVTRAMVRVRCSETLCRVLQWGVTSPDVAGASFMFMLAGAAVNRAVQHTAWQFFVTHKQPILKKLGGAGALLVRAVEHIASPFYTEEKFQEIEQYFAREQFIGIERSLKKGLENIRVKINWSSAQKGDLEQYLKEKYP